MPFAQSRSLAVLEILHTITFVDDLEQPIDRNILDPNDQHSSDLIGDLVPGNSLEAYVSLDRIHIFEADSGLRID